MQEAEVGDTIRISSFNIEAVITGIGRYPGMDVVYTAVSYDHHTWYLFRNEFVIVRKG